MLTRHKDCAMKSAKMTSAIVSDTVRNAGRSKSPSTYHCTTASEITTLSDKNAEERITGKKKTKKNKQREHNIILPVSFYIVSGYKGLSVKRAWNNTAHDIKAVSLCMCFCSTNVFAKKAKAVIMSATIFALLIDNLIYMCSTCMVSMIGTFCSRRR